MSSAIATLAALLLVTWAALLWRRRWLLVRLWREPVLARPVLVIESDDWGPGGVEEAEGLAHLAGTLAPIRDADGRPAILTLGVELARPRGGDPAGQTRRLLDDPEGQPVREAMLAGRKAGVFALQLHGMEHFHPASVRAAAERDESVRAWLASQAPDPWRLPSHLQSRWIRSDVLPSCPLPDTDIRDMATEETAEFERHFGSPPRVAVPPTFVWTEAVERAWSACGIRAIVTPGQRHEGRGEDGAPLPGPRILNGEQAAGGALYLVRDVYFEPARGHRVEQVLAAIAARWREGRPALVESHRFNYVGPGAARHRAALAELLTRALRDAPDLRFVAPAALAAAYARPERSDLFTRSWRRRLAACAARIRREPALRRLLGPAAIAAPLLDLIHRIATPRDAARPAPAR